MPKPKEGMKFEEAFARLEGIVEDLEKGNATLDQAMKSFEEGIALAKWCMKKLNQEEARLKVLIKTEEGTFKLDDRSIPDDNPSG